MCFCVHVCEIERLFVSFICLWGNRNTWFKYLFYQWQQIDQEVCEYTERCSIATIWMKELWKPWMN